jgi:hypothetical protein
LVLRDMTDHDDRPEVAALFASWNVDSVDRFVDSDPSGIRT